MLEDPFGRRFPYLRLSITDVCNFRCAYCLPNGYQKHERSFLELPEIVRLVRAFAGMGMWKIRLTGGEPTVRTDFLDIARAVHAVPGIRTIAVTTNGYRLSKDVVAYREAGITALNVSVDSLDPARFAAVTGQDMLADILNGIALASEAGIETIKLNAVLLKETWEAELDAFSEWMRARPVSVRFIELMRTNENVRYFHDQHISGNFLIRALLARGWYEKPRETGDGPAREFIHPDSIGRFGIIAPYAPTFCETCNRLRVTARGDLRLCLFGKTGYPLRPLLQSDDQMTELQETIVSLLTRKEAGHHLREDDSGMTPHLASVGG